MSVIWTADATKTVDLEWASYSTPASGAVTAPGSYVDPYVFQVADATAAHGRAYRSIMDQNTPIGRFSTGDRCEINMGNPPKTFSNGVDRLFYEGQDRWISCQFKLDASFPSRAQGFIGSSVMQLTHPTGNDGGLFNLAVGQNSGPSVDQWNIWGYTRVTAGNDTPAFNHPIGPLLPTRNKWVKFTFHIKFSSSPAAGIFEVFSDIANPGGFSTLPVLWSVTGRATIKSSAPAALMTFGYYATRPIPSLCGMNMCGLTCATTRAEAEANAFGSGGVGGIPPVAAFTTSPSPATVGVPVTFDASGSTATTPPLTYAWADGATSLGTLKVQTYTFTVAATKHPTLTVTDGAGLTNSVEHDLIVNASNPTPPVAAFTTSPSPATVGQVVTFDASASTGTAPLTYAWADGATSLGTLKVQTYTFPTTGTKRPTLTVTDGNGTKASVEHDLVVNAVPPVASFTTTPSTAVTGSPVVFDASASTGVPPLSYAWTDANGGASLGVQKVQTFTFQNAGTKLATLTVTDGTGATNSVEHDLVVTTPAPPLFPNGELRSQPVLAVGNDYYCKVTTRLPSNLPTSGFVTFRFASIDGPPATTTVPLALGVTVSGGAIKWSLQRGTDYSNDFPWVGPTVDNAWHTFILHVNMDTAAGATGFIELWMDGTKQTFIPGSVQTLNMTTYGTDNNGGANWLSVQSYRHDTWLASYVQGTGQGGGTTAGMLTIYHATPVIGPTFASVG